jgi:hypothetical protein
MPKMVKSARVMQSGIPCIAITDERAASKTLITALTYLLVALKTSIFISRFRRANG